MIWLYYEDLDEALKFYQEVLGARLLVDQGFAKVCSSSATGFIGLVDGAEGLHPYTEEKAVTVATWVRRLMPIRYRRARWSSARTGYRGLPIGAIPPAVSATGRE